MKRALDVAMAGVLGVIALPIAAIVTLAVLVQLGRPVLFRQRRPGLHGKPFMLMKFRTMRDAVAPDGTPLPDAERLTGLGKFLRATSLDELPELWNVLRGDMSLVGPRPLLMEYLPYYSAKQRRRHDVRPGITGWAQVQGRNAVSWEERFKLDVWYVDHRSVWLDLKILAATVPAVLSRRGISAPGDVTMPKFTGGRS